MDGTTSPVVVFDSDPITAARLLHLQDFTVNKGTGATARGTSDVVVRRS
jgi:hypothetical protein